MGSIEPIEFDPLVARGVVLTAENRLVLLRRSFASKSNRGAWELPGGRVNEYEQRFGLDKGLRLARHREIREETGLEVVTFGRKPLEFDKLWQTREGGEALTRFRLMRAIGTEVQICDEHTASAVVPYEAAMTYALTEHSREALAHFGAVICDLAA